MRHQFVLSCKLALTQCVHPLALTRSPFSVYRLSRALLSALALLPQKVGPLISFPSNSYPYFVEYSVGLRSSSHVWRWSRPRETGKVSEAGLKFSHMDGGNQERFSDEVGRSPHPYTHLR
ncbi:hypothetical protein BC827DRAFT_599534 [Russula dissimulans]|nr:hypothetical protein BC827DRAFT_599534 [Russula dissimulans]